MRYGPGLIPTELWKYGTTDVVRGLRAALSNERETDTLPLPDLGDTVPVRSARAGIVLAIRALDLGPGACIGVPLYCCPVVFKAIEAAGCRPRFLDVDPQTFCISAEDLSAKQAGIDALLAVHMFGNVCDVPRLRPLIAGKPIIEDCAQSLGSRIRGQATGTFGDIAVFSFRSGKYISAGEGGALFAGDPALMRRARAVASGLGDVSRRDECLHLVKSFIRSKLRSRPLYGLAGHALWEVYNRSVSYSGKSPLILRGPYRSDLALSRRRLPACAAAIETRRHFADLYAASLRDPVTLCPEMPDAFYNRFQFPILLPSESQRDEATAHLQRHGIEASRPYRDIAGIAAAHYGYGGDCPASEWIAKRVLVVPSHEQLTTSDVQRIARRLMDGLVTSDTSGRASTSRTTTHHARV